MGNFEKNLFMYLNVGLHFTIYKSLFLASNHLIFLVILGGTYCDHVFSAVPTLAI